MCNAVLKSASYILAHTKEMIVHNGTTQTTEKITNKNSEYLKNIRKSLRSFEDICNYLPNQVYIGNESIEKLEQTPLPWYDKKSDITNRFGKFGEIMPELEFIALLQIVDVFDLVILCSDIIPKIKKQLENHPILNDMLEKIKDGTDLDTINNFILNENAEGIYYENKLIGCIKKAHDIDQNLNAHIIFENLVNKASGVLALKNLLYKNNINPKSIDYVIECSEEACGDMNQRGGGNFAKSIAKMCNCSNATGSDTRSFCAAPTHALITAASLVKAGTYKNVVIVAGGSTAKLGMNGKDHVKKGIPILEDVVAGFAALISEDDFINPVINTNIIGKHTVGTGAAPQAVITSLVSKPLENAGLKITDIDKYSVEMQNPDITKPAGAGNVPESNYKMIAALAVMKKELERKELTNFIKTHGMVGFAPTQGHIPSGVPYLGFAINDLTLGKFNKVMIIGKGSLFLGRMTNLFDGVSVVIERNKGKGKNKNEKVITEKKLKIGLTTFGSEHGIENLINGAKIAKNKNSFFDIVLIGEKNINCTDFDLIEAKNEKEAHLKIEQLLENGELDAAVTMHYNFPIGIATVGKAITPMGKEILISTTTGMSNTKRIPSMLLNCLYGIGTAKTLGIKNPKVGVLNVDGGTNVNNILNTLNENGYKINFSSSIRKNENSLMRGNDLVNGDIDVMVTDTLTGNIIMKMFSSFNSGGTYETMGYGYGAGTSPNYNKIICILSRASGAPVVANSLIHAYNLAKGKLFKNIKKEFENAEIAGLNNFITPQSKCKTTSLKIPKEEIATAEISGIDIMSLDEATKVLWENNIFAKTGMGCTGPVILVNNTNLDISYKLLKNKNFL